MSIQKALVIDDSKVAHLALSRLLKARGIEVDWLGSGEDALHYLERQAPPDVVFMDILMPGMNGFQATRAINDSPAIRATPIVMCSGNTTAQDKQQADESGAFGFLSKPYTPEQLDEILESVDQRLNSIKHQPKDTAASQGAEAPARAIIEAAERAARAVSDEVARAVAAEVASFTAEQTARAIAQDSGRAAVEEADRSARNVAVQASGEVAEAARRAAEEAARSVAEETANTVAANVAREIAQGITLSSAQTGDETAKSIQSMRGELKADIERSAVEWVRSALAEDEIRKQLDRSILDSLLPRVESVARHAAAQAASQSARQVMEQAAAAETVGEATDPGARIRANLALAAAVVALVVSVAASALL